MTFIDAVSLALLLGFIAMLPSSSVVLVVSQTLAAGKRAGISTVLGIVVGDALFVVFVISGLSAALWFNDGLPDLLALLGSVCLIGMGMTQWCALNKTPSDPTSVNKDTHSFMAGLLLTLVDVKAIAFYFGLFPAYLDLLTMTIFDFIVIMLVVIVSITAAKLLYVIGADKAKTFLQSKQVQQKVSMIAALLLILLGCCLLLRVWL